MAAYRGFATWQPTGSFTGWTLGIARNLVKMRWRTLSRSRTVIADQGLLDSLADINAELDGELEAERLALRHCLQAIGGRSWEVLRLHYWEGLAAAAVAQRLSLAVGHVRVQLHRLRGSLRDCIARRMVAESRHG